MYNITRNEAAKIIWVSTRSIDRYIKSWKLRSEKVWKMIYINNQDLDNIWWVNKNTQHVIINENEIKDINNEWLEKRNNKNKDDFIYTELLNSLKEKDKKIENLSIQIGKAEQIIKNSISIIDYKKTQYLLEQKEETIRYELEKGIENNKIMLEKERNINKILLIIWFLLLITSIIIWFSKI